MKIVLTGGTGFVGRALVNRLLAGGHDLAVLTRDVTRARSLLPEGVACHTWNAPGDPPLEALSGAEALIHLAGEGVADGRWTARRRRRIRESRVLGARRLLEALRKAGEKPGVILSASAVGFYGNRGNEVLSEEAAPGAGFLAEVCRDWEQALFSAELPGTRRAALRIGMVLGGGGGALARLLPVFRLGLGGPVGGGRQWMSWIHRADLVELIVFALENRAVEGPVNAVAPNPVRNGEFTRILASVLRRPAVLPVPGPLLKLALGEMASIVLEGQRVEPAAAASHGFRFRFEKLREALEDICGRR